MEGLSSQSHLLGGLSEDVSNLSIVPIQNFGAPSFDDKKLEVVAVFGSIQMAVSRVINLQHHRIAQVDISGLSRSLVARPRPPRSLLDHGPIHACMRVV